MQQKELIEAITAYLYNLDNSPVNTLVKEEASIYLSGSTGWGIQEGFDERADWDLHIILSNESYAKISHPGEADPLINDPKSRPTVFGQIRNKEWFHKRLNSLQNGDCTYQWIYTNGLMIDDKQAIAPIIAASTALFQRNLDNLIRYHYIRFAIARFSTAASARREIRTAAHLYNAEMIELALQTFCLLQGTPYAYPKWLHKQVALMGDTSAKLLQQIEKNLNSTTFRELDGNARALKNCMQDMLTDKLGKLPWIMEWWNYNQNPPDLNLRT